MATKKKVARKINITLDKIREGLEAGKYNVAVGARRAASKLPDADKAKAEKLIADYFGATATVGKTKVPVEKKASKRVGKKVSSRFAKNPEVAPVVAEAKVKKPRGRRPKGDETSSPKAVFADSKKMVAKVSDTDRMLYEVGFRGNIIDVVGRGISTLERAQQMSGNRLEIQGVLQEASDTIGAAVSSIRKLMPGQHPEQSLPIDTLSDVSENPPVLEGDRPSNHAAAMAAAAATGVPVPSEHSLS